MIELVKQAISYLVNYDDDRSMVEGGGDDRSMVEGGGGPELRKREPEIVKDDQVRIKIVAAGVSRCDMLASWPKIPGHQCSGIITALGKHVTHWNLGDKVCALLDGGGYAAEVVVSADRILGVPSTVNLADAASLPYAACTVWLAFTTIQHSLSKKKTILINDADSAIGCFATQFAKYKGFKVIATSETRNGMLLNRELGADVAIVTPITWQDPPPFDETLIQGVDVKMDCLSWNRHNVRFLDRCGIRLIVDPDTGAEFCAINLVAFYEDNLQLQVINLRNQSEEEKASIVDQVRKNIWPLIEEGQLKPVISHRLPLAAAKAATNLIRQVQTYGTVLLYP